MTRSAKARARSAHRVSIGLFIASLFIGSALLRVVSPSTAAIAQETVSQIRQRAAEPDRAESGGRQSASSDAALADELRERQRNVAEREKEISMRDKELSILLGEVEMRIADLEATERELASLVNTASKLAAADVENLTIVYENMKPKRAGALFEKMKPDFAAGFLRGMPPEAASRILTEMSAESAYALSVVLAGQHQDIPK